LLALFGAKGTKGGLAHEVDIKHPKIQVTRTRKKDLKMKFELLNLLLCTTLTGQAMAATIDYCKGVNLSGDCRRVSVANDGKCSTWKHHDNFEDLAYTQKIMLRPNTMITSGLC
jgi:hypothetical protein